MSSDLSSYRTAVVKSLVEDLSGVKQDVSQVSASLRTKVSPIDDNKAEEVGKPLERDIGILGARYEALVGLANETSRTEVLDAFERVLNATDAILDTVEETLHRTEGLEPVIVPPNLELDIGLPFGAVGGSGDSGTSNVSVTDTNGAKSSSAAVSSPQTQARATRRTEALQHRTPVRNRAPVMRSGTSLVTPVRTTVRRVEDELPPTPKLSDYGITDTGLFDSDLNFSYSNAGTATGTGTGGGARTGLRANTKTSPSATASTGANLAADTRNHILQEATSPEQEDDQAYDETVTRHMARLGLRQSRLDIRQDDDEDEDDGDMTYDETITRQMEELGIDDSVTRGYR